MHPLFPALLAGSLAHAALPTRQLAGVTVVDTPIVRAAQAFAQSNSSPWVYSHVMRSWLFGALMLQHNTTLSCSVDHEVHAVSALLHDLGWDRAPHSPHVSADKRFEVDGAEAARGWLRSYGREMHEMRGVHERGGGWGEIRMQRVWDAIALHTERSIAFYKEDEVRVVSMGILMDFVGPVWVPREGYEGVVREFPKDGLKEGVNETLIWLCESKGDTTVDTWMQPWGEHYVEGYETKGKRRFDTIFANL